MKHDDVVYLHQMLDAISTIESYLLGVDELAFHDRKLLQDGVSGELEIIGEVAKRVSPEMRAAHPEVPWQDMAGMRNRLIHDYLNVDVNRVWLTAKNDLPQLKKQIEQVLGGENR